MLFLPSAMSLMRLCATSLLTRSPPCSNTAFIVAMNQLLSGANVSNRVKKCNLKHGKNGDDKRVEKEEEEEEKEEDIVLQAVLS